LNNKSGALVIGGHFQGLGVVRALAKKNIPIVVIDHEPCLSRFSKYVWRFWKCPPPCQENQFVNFLVELASKLGDDKWIIFPTDDLTLKVLSKHKRLLEKYFHITTPDWNVTRLSYYKKKSYILAEQLGIPIPKTYYPKSLRDVLNYDLSFPILIKPDVMNCFISKTGKKVFRARNKDELIHFYKKASTAISQDEILLQDEIPKAHKNLYSFCPMIKDGRVLARVVAKRIRQHPMDFGRASTFVESVQCTELESLGVKMLKAMKFYGICEVEFVYDIRDKTYKFLEINPRIWGWHSIAQSAGVNLPFLLYSDILGTEVNVPSFEIGKKWMHWVTDTATSLVEIVNGRMSLKDYFSSIQKIDEFAVLSWKDPIPFIVELMMLPYLIKKRGF